MPLTFSKVRANYNTIWNAKHKHPGIPPPAFEMDLKENWRQKAINSCAVRLSDAITRVDPKFFFGEKSEKNGWQEPLKSGGRRLPIRPNEIADTLDARIGRRTSITSRESLSGKHGIVFFDHIPGYDGNGHISLWDNDGIVDQIEPWDATAIYFWPLPDDQAAHE